MRRERTRIGRASVAITLVAIVLAVMVTVVATLRRLTGPALQRAEEGAGRDVPAHALGVDPFASLLGPHAEQRREVLRHRTSSILESAGPSIYAGARSGRAAGARRDPSRRREKHGPTLPDSAEP